MDDPPHGKTEGDAPTIGLNHRSKGLFLPGTPAPPSCSYYRHDPNVVYVVFGGNMGKDRVTNEKPISLHPLDFEDVIRALSGAGNVARREDSQSDASGSTKANDPESEPSEPQSARSQTSSDD